MEGSRLSGLFITLEGPEGAGKTTQASELARQLGEQGWPVLLTREPGGTALGNRVRELVLAHGDFSIGSRAETLLYCAARAQLVEERLKPALAEGQIVIVDRYADSTLAYQGYARGLDPNSVRAVLDFATAGLTPDLTLLLDLPVALGLARKRVQAAAASQAWNRFESEAVAFHERVRQAYRLLARTEPERWLVLDATRSSESVSAEILAQVDLRLARTQS